MRLIMLDTETTGVSFLGDDRIVEIGALEVADGKVLHDRTFHHYINPERDIPDMVVRLHGIDNKRVEGCPIFADIAEDFFKFVEGATLVIHNATFDIRFLYAELKRAGLSGLDHVPVIDSLQVARDLFPNERDNLNALCDRFEIERGHRELHGALLDSQLLAQVWFELNKHDDINIVTKRAENFAI